MFNFPAKRVSEIVALTVDYATTNLLAPTEVIISATWTNSVRPGSGIDPSPGAMVDGPATIDPTGSKVTQLYSGGIAGVTYQPICTALTNQGQIIVLPDPGQGALFVIN